MSFLFDDQSYDVEPGDLITAGDYNRLLAWLQDLEARVSNLEGADESVAITGLIPAGPVRVGDTLEVLGRNFGFSAGAHRVYFNSTRATQFDPESGETRLVLEVPRVPGVSEAGTPVTLTVGNQTSVDTAQVTVRPEAVQQTGSIGILYTGAQREGEAITTIQPGTTVDFTYNLESDTELDTTVQITPTISIPDWQPRLEVVDGSGEVLPSRQIDLAAGASTTFAIRLPLPTGTEDTPFTLTVRVTAADLPDVDDAQSFTVGSEVTPADPALRAWRIRDVNPSAARDGDTLNVSAGQTVHVQLQLEFNAPAGGESYTYTFSGDDMSAPWSVVAPSTFIPFDNPTEFVIDAETTQNVSFQVERGTGAAGQATVTCRLTREDPTTGETVETSRQYTLRPT
jgi:hypothetical protein